MNPGASAFLIFLFIVGAFAGLGYLIPEMNQRTVENKELNEQKIALGVELETTRQIVLTRESELEKARTRIGELERAVETERRIKDATLTRLLEVQEAYKEAQSQIITLQAELKKSLEKPNINTFPPETYPANANYEVILPWLPPVFLLALAGGYGFHRAKLGKVWFSTRRDEASDSSDLQDPETEIASPADKVTVLVPRDRIPEFVKWLRQRS